MLLLVVLIILLRALLRSQPSDAIVVSRGVWRWLMIVFLFALIISVPIGLVLAHVRAG